MTEAKQTISTDSEDYLAIVAQACESGHAALSKARVTIPEQNLRERMLFEQVTLLTTLTANLARRLSAVTTAVGQVAQNQKTWCELDNVNTAKFQALTDAVVQLQKENTE